MLLGKHDREAADPVINADFLSNFDCISSCLSKTCFWGWPQYTTSWSRTHHFQCWLVYWFCNFPQMGGKNWSQPGQDFLLVPFVRSEMPRFASQYVRFWCPVNYSVINMDNCGENIFVFLVRMVDPFRIQLNGRQGSHTRKTIQNRDDPLQSSAGPLSTVAPNISIFWMEEVNAIVTDPLTEDLVIIQNHIMMVIRPLFWLQLYIWQWGADATLDSQWYCIRFLGFDG